MCRPRHHALLSTLTFLSTIIYAASSGSLPDSTPESKPRSLVAAETETNSNHIFNAVHSSMRQWGSSVYHNGMSFFLATVPQGTQFYHGTHVSEPVKGTEWLAFEPEHAMLFARPHHRPPPPPPGAPKTGYGESKSQKPLSHSAAVEDEMPDSESGMHRDPDSTSHGWLHTYMTIKDLRLLYIDGMSAGKTQNGTLDSQDRILLNLTGLQNPGFHEEERAQRICHIAQNDWKDRIDGVIRMEAGFEIILCSFERDLQFLRMTRVKSSDGKHFGEVSLPSDDDFERVQLNYENFVTAYDDTYGLDLFNGSTITTTDNDYDNKTKLQRLPRLERVPNDKLEPIRRDLFNLVLTTHDTDTVERERERDPSFNWQAVTDMIIQRYADELKYLISDSTFSKTDQIHAEIYRVLEPFIDADERNATLEISACTDQFIPTTPRFSRSERGSGSLTGRAIRSVTNTICSTLVNALEEPTYEVIVNSIEQLIEYLAWSVWKECRGCSQNEVCALPMWPWGTMEDYERPRCRSANDIDGDGERYWGRPPFH